ncbi:MAG: RNA polymerase sigma-70 factor [Bacteroidetes bacterium]|nr:RNA polymerase sigma-70 factor [Bacteroidota bacterium]
MRQEDFEELALIGELREGNPSAFRQLYAAYGPRLYAFCKRFGISAEDAREVIQETFIRVWERRLDIRTGTSFSAYLFTIARNIIYNAMRHAAYLDKYLGEAGGEPSVSISADERELQQLIGEAVQQLPDKCRQVFRKSRYEGLSNQEIADELSISKSTVENQLNKALRSIRTFLKSNGYGTALLLSAAGLNHLLTDLVSK